MVGRRLLFVIKDLALGGGGAERVLSGVASELAERGHEVTVASFHSSSANDFYATSPRVTRLRLGLFQGEHTMSLVLLLRAIRRLRKLLDELNPELAIGFMYSAYVPLGIAAIGRVPIISSEHSVNGFYESQGLRRFALPIGLRLAEASTAPSRSAQQTFSPSLAARMTVIPNPVDFVPLPRQIMPNARKRVLAVGRLRPEKRHDLLITAFAMIAKRFPGWELVLVGDGEERGNLEALAAAMGIADQVVFVGPVARVEEQYAAAELFVLPSSIESFALVVAEALRAGLPVIGMDDCPPLVDFVTDGQNGLVVSATNPAENLAGALERLMTDEALRARLGARGPEAVAGFTLPEVAARWEALIEKVLGKGA